MVSSFYNIPASKSLFIKLEPVNCVKNSDLSELNRPLDYN